jgi:2-polyprenyl-6-hydroxyphenyl methylase/3-demethylubiquinone-9 3-methyltransferase
MSLRWRIAQKLELAWWRCYLTRRPSAAYLEAKKRYWQRLLNTAGLALRPGSRILDAGCGPAGIFLVLYGHEVVAIDPLIAAYSTYLPVFEPARYPWVVFRACRLEDFADASGFDLACCMNAVNHVEDWEGCLRQLHQLLRPEGRLLLSVDVHRRKGWQRLLQGSGADLLHPHQHRQEEYLTFLGKLGFKDLSFHRIRAGKVFDHVLISARKNG